MGRPLAKGRQREFVYEIEIAIAKLGAVSAITEYTLAEICRVDLSGKNHSERKRFEKAAEEIGSHLLGERRKILDRLIFKPGTPDCILSDDEYRRMRQHYLGRLRDKERRSAVAKITISDAHLDRLRELLQDGETQRAALERLIDAAYKRSQRTL